MQKIHFLEKIKKAEQDILQISLMTTWWKPCFQKLIMQPKSYKTLGPGNRFEAETTISSCACERPACSGFGKVLYLTAPKYERN